MSDFGQRIYRIAVAESETFPALAQEFYESGPKLVRDRIAECLSNGVERGELVIDDIPFAAAQFAQLCKADLHDPVSYTHLDVYKRQTNMGCKFFHKTNSPQRHRDTEFLIIFSVPLRLCVLIILKFPIANINKMPSNCCRCCH